MKLSIAKKLGIGFFFVSILIVLVGYLGLHGIYRVRDINQVITKPFDMNRIGEAIERLV